MRLWDTILDLIFGAKCVACSVPGRELCIKCLMETSGAERETEKWIFPLYDYRSPPIKKALWFLKYKGKKRLAHVFAEAMYGRILEELADFSLMENFQDPILIPVPLSKKKISGTRV